MLVSLSLLLITVAYAASAIPIAIATTGADDVLDAVPGGAAADAVAVCVAVAIVDALAFDAKANVAEFDAVAFAVDIVVFVQLLLVKNNQLALQTRIKSKVPQEEDILFTRTR